MIHFIIFGLNKKKTNKQTIKCRSKQININQKNVHSYQSRFLNKSKSSAVVALQPSIDDDTNTGEDSDNKYGTGRSRYLALKERRSRLARSRSSHLMGNDDEDGLDQPVSPTTASPSAYLASRFDDICCILYSYLSFSLSPHTQFQIKQKQ